MPNRKNKIVAAVAAALAAGAIGGGIAVAGATPTPPPPAPTTVVDIPDAPGAIDTPEPGDTPDTAGADQDNVQDKGPEVPDTPKPAPPR